MARPRDPEIDVRALDAARRVLRDEGYDQLSMARVAKLAEASAPALYRRWPTVAHLAFDAARGTEAPEPPPDTGSFETDLRATIESFVEVIEETHQGLLADRFGEMMANEDFANHVYEESVVPATEATVEIWDRAVERGEVRADVDGFELFLDVTGIVLHRSLMLQRPPTKVEVDALVERTLHGVSPR